MFATRRKEQTESPIDMLLSAFTVNAERINTLWGFPGGLLLVGIVALGLPLAPNVDESTGLYFVSGGALLASSVTYAAQWFYSARAAEAQSVVLREWTRPILEGYLRGKDKIDLEAVNGAMDGIVLKLLVKQNRH